jgi:choloylglycine hydrolase
VVDPVRRRAAQVGTFTNDPDFRWHQRNLNNFVNLSPDWPAGGAGIQVQSEVGALPSVVGHGFNLLGVPGDYSPPSRFVRLFYLRQYAMLKHPPTSLNATIALATGLLNNVFIAKGTVASSMPGEVAEFTQYSVLKMPAKRELYFKDYDNTRWRRVRLDALDLSPRQPAAPSAGFPLVDGTLGVEDVTARLLS